MVEAVTMNIDIMNQLTMIGKKLENEKRKLQVYTEHNTGTDSKGVKKPKEHAQKAYDYFKNLYKIRSNTIENDIQAKRDQIEQIESKLSIETSTITSDIDKQIEYYQKQIDMIKAKSEQKLLTLKDKFNFKKNKLEKEIEFLEDEENDAGIMRFKTGMISNELILNSDTTPLKTLGQRNTERAIEFLEDCRSMLLTKVKEWEKDEEEDSTKIMKYILEQRDQMNAITLNRYRANQKAHAEIAKEMNKRIELEKQARWDNVPEGETPQFKLPTIRIVDGRLVT